MTERIKYKSDQKLMASIFMLGMNDKAQSLPHMVKTGKQIKLRCARAVSTADRRPVDKRRRLGLARA